MSEQVAPLSERMRRQVDRLLDEADEAARQRDWDIVRARAETVLSIDPGNPDALTYLTAVQRAIAEPASTQSSDRPATTATSPLEREPTGRHARQPTAFVGGRYRVVRSLGEGGKKRVYLAHDTQLDREVAFSLIKGEGLDPEELTRVRREAQAMGRLGDHPHIVTVYDIGEEGGQPYIVSQYMAGGSLQALIDEAEDHRLAVEQARRITDQVCDGLAYAHGRGVIHRDLKPGNIWLTADGVAKIGDFGLALALDHSRLTQTGIMVGTVSYMAPEQATGGEVTARSDLYALGALLYELVTGRPPFIGDESVAIIGQHLNTPPVAPSWHRPDCPPGLEALILRLLEKDPAKRPASAAETRQALAGVRPHPHPLPEGEGVDASPSGRGRPEGPGEGRTSDPLYQRVFVGREQELRQLQAAFDAALSGQGSLAMVVGEPGIGKTSLCEQLATYVALRGGKPLVGHCYEEGSLSLPYLPFVEAMRSYVLAREPDGLRTDLGSGAGEVARIVSEVRDKVQVSPAAGGEPEEQRYRLLQAVSGFLRNASLVQPLLVVLEDLHDADHGTLDLLLHLARNLQGVRLLLVGTYRDVEVDRAHPLSGALAELRRGSAFQRVPLRGLTVDEVHRMYTAIRGQEVRWAQAEAVHRQTEGNPLFVQEVLRYLVEEGIVVREGGRYVPAGGVGAGIPEGLRDVVGKRLSRLSEQTNQVLSVACVIGREFRLDVLQRVAEVPDDELTAALKEAHEKAIVEERGGVGAVVTYRFNHAFFRQTLYEEIIAPLRIRLHQQVARALEAVHARRLEEHATELAEHFSYSSTADDLAKAVGYGELAAQRSMAVYAYGEAARHLEQAIKVQEILDPDDRAKRCDLLLALGEALVPGGDPTRAAESVAPETFALAQALDDRARTVRACLLALSAYGRLSGRPGTGLASPEGQKWADLADQHTPPDTLERVRVDRVRGYAANMAGRPAEAWQLFKRAYALAERLDDDEAILDAAFNIVGASQTPIEDYPSLIDIADRVTKRELTGQNPRMAWTYTAAGEVFLSWARRDEAEKLWDRARGITDTTQDPLTLLFSFAQEALRRTLDGQFEAALALGAQAQEHGQQHGMEAQGRAFSGRMVRRPLVYLGRYQEGLDSVPEASPGSAALAVYVPQRAYSLAYLGRTEEAREILRLFLERMKDPEAHIPATFYRYLLEAAVVARDTEAVAELAPRMRSLAPYLFTEVLMCFCIARHLGDAAALLGQAEEARAYYQQAIELCTKVRFRPEIALSRLGLAELLLAHYPDERAEAIEHLDFAIGEFREMQTQPSLERALKHRELLKA